MVGSLCLDRNNITTANKTYIDKRNPSTEDGYLTQVCVYVNYSPSGGTIQTKTFKQILGLTWELTGDSGNISVMNGLNTITGISLPIVVNGVIGFYSSNCELEMTMGLTDPVDPSPGTLNSIIGNVTGVGTQVTFTSIEKNRSISLEGLIGIITCPPISCAFTI